MTKNFLHWQKYGWFLKLCSSPECFAFSVLQHSSSHPSAFPKRFVAHFDDCSKASEHVLGKLGGKNPTLDCFKILFSHYSLCCVGGRGLHSLPHWSHWHEPIVSVCVHVCGRRQTAHLLWGCLTVSTLQWAPRSDLACSRCTRLPLVWSHLCEFSQSWIHFPDYSITMWMHLSPWHFCEQSVSSGRTRTGPSEQKK